MLKKVPVGWVVLALLVAAAIALWVYSGMTRKEVARGGVDAYGRMWVDMPLREGFGEREKA